MVWAVLICPLVTQKDLLKGIKEQLFTLADKMLILSGQWVKKSILGQEKTIAIPFSIKFFKRKSG